MNIKYKKNCQLYYDEKEKATFIVKRNAKYMIKNNQEDYDLLQSIIGKSVDKIAVDNVIENDKKALQYIKLLLDRGILYADQDIYYPIEHEFQDYIISNFDDHYKVLDFISQSRIAIKNDPQLTSLYNGKGIWASNVEGVYDDIIHEFNVFIGDFDEKELGVLLDNNRHVLLLRKIGGACAILYMNRYDENLLDQFKKFYINSSSESPFGNKILPINILMHLLENIFVKGSKNLKFITADATVQLFHLKEIDRDTLKYYDRTLVAKKDNLAIIREIEEMTKTNPNFVKDTNKENATLCHAPICNYEVCFGYNLNNHRSSRYHEDNAMAGILAITDGIEHALRTMKPSEHWVCATSVEEYYLKGYLSLLATIDKPKPANEVTISSTGIRSLLDFIHTCYGLELKLYFQNIYNNVVGNIYITDLKGDIIYKAKNVWQSEKAIMEGLYDIIGRCENEQDLTNKERLSYVNEKSVNIEDRTTEEMLTLISDYFTSRSILVDEKPWAYQSCFETTGLHIGSFYFVK